MVKSTPGWRELIAAAEFSTRLRDERVAFFRDVLGPFVRRFRGGVTFIRLVDGVDVTDAVKAADGRRVFELHR